MTGKGKASPQAGGRSQKGSSERELRGGEVPKKGMSCLAPPGKVCPLSTDCLLTPNPSFTALLVIPEYFSSASWPEVQLYQERAVKAHWLRMEFASGSREGPAFPESCRTKQQWGPLVVLTASRTQWHQSCRWLPRQFRGATPACGQLLLERALPITAPSRADSQHVPQHDASPWMACPDPSEGGCLLVSRAQHVSTSV